MKYALICFDLQGTLSNSEFSDSFWFETLPELYQKAKGIETLEESKRVLRDIFSEYGKYDLRYYSVKYWIKELGLNAMEEELISLIKVESIFYPDTELLLQQLAPKSKVILLSTTVRSFMKKELQGRENLFLETYSALEDLSTAGKKAELYQKIAELYNVKPEEAINIGDNEEMDILNAAAAGWDTFFFDKKLARDKVLGELKVKLKDNL